MLKIRRRHVIVAGIIVAIAAACAVPLPALLPGPAGQPVPATADSSVAVAATERPLATATGLPPTAVAATALPATVLPATVVVPPVAYADSLLVAAWVASTRRSELRAVQPLTGEPLPGYPPIDLGRSYLSAFSPQARTLAIIVYPSSETSHGGLVHLIDLSTWRDTPTQIQVDEWAAIFQFTPDGRGLLISAAPGQNPIEPQTLTLYDTATQQAVAQAELPVSPRQVAFTPDGSGLMVYGTSTTQRNGTNPQARALLLDTAGLTVAWQVDLAGVFDGQFLPEGSQNVDDSIWWSPAVVFAPEQQILYLVQANADRLTSVDFGQRVYTTTPIAPAQSVLDRLMALTAGVAEAKMLNGATKQAVLSLDGQRLYVVGQRVASRQDTDGNYTFDQTSLGLKVVEAATGLELQTLAIDAQGISQSTDGQYLFLENWVEQQESVVLRAADLTVVKRLPGVRLLAGSVLSGQPLLLALREGQYRTGFQPLDPAAFEPLARWDLVGSGYPLLLP